MLLFKTFEHVDLLFQPVKSKRDVSKNALTHYRKIFKLFLFAFTPFYTNRVTITMSGNLFENPDSVITI